MLLSATSLALVAGLITGDAVNCRVPLRQLKFSQSKDRCPQHDSPALEGAFIKDEGLILKWAHQCTCSAVSWLQSYAISPNVLHIKRQRAPA